MPPAPWTGASKKMTFDDLKLAPAIVQAVREHGYETPTPIQAEAIPAVLKSADVWATAPTGSGKTLAFALPLVQHHVLQPLLCGQGVTGACEFLSQVGRGDGDPAGGAEEGQPQVMKPGVFREKFSKPEPAPEESKYYQIRKDSFFLNVQKV